MNDAEYATSKHIKLHRYLSVGLVIVVTIIESQGYNSLLAIRRMAAFVLPLTLIWYSDQLACWAIRTSGHWLNSSNSDVAVRIAEWMMLLVFSGLKLLPIILQ